MARRRSVSVGDEPTAPIKATRKIKPPLPKLEDEALALVKEVEGITVKTPAECSAAAKYAHDIRQKRKMWEAHEKPVVDKAKAAYDEARDRYNMIAKPMKQAEDSLKLAIGNFKLGAKRIAETASKLSNEAQVQQDMDRLGDFLKREEDARAAAMAARQAEIDAARNAGDLEKAERLLLAPLDVELPDLLPQGMTIGPGELVAAIAPEDGVSVSEQWAFEILSPAVVPDQYWSVDPKLIQAAIAVTKGATRIPGVRVYPKPRVSLR